MPLEPQWALLLKLLAIVTLAYLAFYVFELLSLTSHTTVIFRKSRSDLANGLLFKNGIHRPSLEDSTLNHLINHRFQRFFHPATEPCGPVEDPCRPEGDDSDGDLDESSQSDVRANRQRGLAELEALIRAKPDASSKAEMVAFLTTFREKSRTWLVTSSDLQRIYRKVQPNLFRQAKAGLNQIRWVPDIKTRFFRHDAAVQARLKSAGLA